MTDAATSKTILGIVIAVAGPFAARYGIDEADLELIVQGVTAAIGGLLAIWGRQTATGPITHVLTVPVPQSLIPTVQPTLEPTMPDVAATIDQSK